MNWFDVDKKGLAKVLGRRSKAFVLLELIQNAWDQKVSEVRTELFHQKRRGWVTLVVEDDDPEGFSDLSHAYTLFAESRKKSNPRKRGRFNLGEKLVLALCEEATISTTKGTINFGPKGRRKSRVKRKKGSLFTGSLKMTDKEMSETSDIVVQLLIPPENIKTTFNGHWLRPDPLVARFEESLRTEISDRQGNLRPTTRKTAVEIYAPRTDQRGWLFEMGIPIVETGDRWHVNVLQKVPLNIDRENVPPAFLRHLRTAVLNHTHELVDHEDASQPWVREATGDSRCTPEALRTAMDKRFGEKRVIFDPSDPEANKLAVSKGYTVVGGGQLNKGEWSNVKAAKDMLPAGRVTPSPKPYSNDPDAPPVKVVPREKWTKGMLRMEAYSRWLARELMGVELQVTVVSTTNNFSACYGSGLLTFNVRQLGKKWFEGPFGTKHDWLLIHEFGHQYSHDHLSSCYHKALSKLGAIMVEIALEKSPNQFRSFRRL